MGKSSEIEKIRRDYGSKALREEDAAPDPFLQFEKWFAEALEAELVEPNAMTLATSTPDGKPSARTVLMKEFDSNGIVFYTNYDSDKGKHLAKNPQAALLFFWGELERQVRIEGSVERVSRERSERYFKSRPRDAQISASISAQSREVSSRAELELKVRQFSESHSGEIHCPKNWGGYCLKPESFEFWQGRSNRLHDRLLYKSIANSWKMARLAP